MPIRPGSGEAEAEAQPDDDTEDEEALEEGEERPRQASNPGKLLDRLLCCGKLPRYAFPTDVATLHGFDRDRSSRLRPIMRFAPSQGLPIALTQYAPGKQVWISGKCYTSGAIYSVMPDDRSKPGSRSASTWSAANAVSRRPLTSAKRAAARHSTAWHAAAKRTSGPGRYWLRPPGFAHPVDLEEVTSPNDMPETSYATRAKLTMGTPPEEAGRTPINDHVRVLTRISHRG